MKIDVKSFNDTADKLASPARPRPFVHDQMVSDAYERCYEPGKTVHGDLGYVLTNKSGVVNARVSYYMFGMTF